MPEFRDSLSRLSSSALNAASSFFEKKRAQNQFDRAQFESLCQQNYRSKLYEMFKDNYRAFADGFKNCLESNHTWYGLSCPKRIEDIFPQGKADMIDGQLFSDGSYKDLIFRFEIKRQAVNANIHTISAGTLEYVPAKEIERQLQIELPKYIGDYYFTGLTVFEIPDDKVSVVIQGVDRPPTQQFQNWGMMIW